MTKPWLSIRKYATKYGIDQKTVVKWMLSERLQYFHEGRIVRIEDLPPKERRSPYRPTSL